MRCDAGGTHLDHFTLHRAKGFLPKDAMEREIGIESHAGEDGCVVVVVVVVVLVLSGGGGWTRLNATAVLRHARPRCLFICCADTITTTQDFYNPLIPHLRVVPPSVELPYRPPLTVRTFSCRNPISNESP